MKHQDRIAAGSLADGHKLVALDACCQLLNPVCSLLRLLGKGYRLAALLLVAVYGKSESLHGLADIPGLELRGNGSVRHLVVHVLVSDDLLQRGLHIAAVLSPLGSAYLIGIAVLLHVHHTGQTLCLVNLQHAAVYRVAVHVIGSVELYILLIGIIQLCQRHDRNHALAGLQVFCGKTGQPVSSGLHSGIVDARKRDSSLGFFLSLSLILCLRLFRFLCLLHCSGGLCCGRRSASAACCQYCRQQKCCRNCIFSHTILPSQSVP